MPNNRAGFDFGVTSDRVQITDPTLLNTPAVFTAVSWVKPDALAGSGVLFRRGTTVTTGWNLGVTGSTGNIRCQVARSSANANYFTTVTPLAILNRWYRVMITWDINAAAGSLFKIYVGDVGKPLVDITPASPTNGSGTQVNDSGTNFAIGGHPAAGQASFPGVIASAALFLQKLTPEVGMSVTDAMWEGSPYLPGPYLPDVYYQFGLESGATITDLSRNRWSGAITGAARQYGTNPRPRRKVYYAGAAAAAAAPPFFPKSPRIFTIRRAA